MKIYHLFYAAAALTLSATAFGGSAIDDTQMGLSKTSVYDAPDPIVATDTAGMPGQNMAQPAYFTDAPPQIPHQVTGLLPITIHKNSCMGCHNNPAMMGKKAPKGMAPAMPASHYTDLRRAPGKVMGRVIGARYNCNQCHAPQADAPPLVSNTYTQP